MEDIVNNQPLVTVGICCYNREDGFKNTLKYITGQTYKNLEIIISQDFNATMDFTPIANALGDDRVTFYKQPERLSMYNNFRFLLEKANGEYFMWASDDDWWAPEFVEKIMKMLCADPTAIMGHPYFIAVDENNEKITSYPDFLPFLQEFTIAHDVKRVRNYINQYEGFGKANLFYSIFKTSALRSSEVIALLAEGNLPCDMLIILTVIIKGKLALAPELLRTCTAGNVKHYDQLEYQPKKLNLGIAYINLGGMAHMYKKWRKFIADHFKIVGGSNLSFIKKVALYPTLLKKLFLFYYDLVCCHVQLRGYNIFSKMRREHFLN